MCELFALSSWAPVSIGRQLQTFFSHSPMHPHGWGLVRIADGRQESYRGPGCASQSKQLHDLLREPNSAATALAHIRLATIGYIEQENCHPFLGKDHSGRQWTLVHNGTIFSGRQLNPYIERQAGSTDSERILLYLIDAINCSSRAKGRALFARERFQIVEQVVSSLSEHNKLNLAIYDGELLYIHCNTEGTLFCRQEDRQMMFATTPLEDGGWYPAPFLQLCAYKDGELKYQGNRHRGEYIPNQKDLDQLYQTYSGL